MAHIKVPTGLPGIIGPMSAYPDTAKPMNELAQNLLSRDSSTFSKADRETIASYVSFLNDCQFCSESHGAVADYHLKQIGFSRQLWKDIESAPVSERLKSLLRIAAKVQKAARSVTSQDIEAAIRLGATEHDIHDTVLIAAAFCMYNRYVDGLGTFAPPRGDSSYVQMGQMLAENGYIGAV